MYGSSASRGKRSGSRPGSVSDLTLSVDSALGLKSRPNSAPLQSPPGMSTVPVVGSSAASSDSMSLVEQRLRIVKRNRSKGAEEGGAGGAGGAGGSGLPTIASKAAMYPAQDSTALTKQDKSVVEAITRDVLDALFFSVDSSAPL
jgi:hypothetical protein